MPIRILGTSPLFVYGRLLDHRFRRAALRGTQPPFRDAILRDYRTVDVPDGFKNLEPYSGEFVRGRVLYVRPNDLKELDELSKNKFERRPVVVVSGVKEIETEAYFMKQGAFE